jgi:hypothetical protein
VPGPRAGMGNGSRFPPPGNDLRML